MVMTKPHAYRNLEFFAALFDAIAQGLIKLYKLIMRKGK